MGAEEIKRQMSRIQRLLDILRKMLGIQTLLEKKLTELMVVRIAQKYQVNVEKLVATIWCESGMNPKAVNRNPNGTTDYGLCQFNDYWYRDIISPDEALNNPEKAVHVMCQMWEKGRQNDWICYRSTRYLSFMKYV